MQKKPAELEIGMMTLLPSLASVFGLSGKAAADDIDAAVHADDESRRAARA